MILAVAPTGARRGKNDHAHLPISVDEIAQEARACADAGAALLHLHVRGPQGAHSIDAGYYEEAIAAVRETAGDRLLIQATTESAGIFSRSQQVAAATSFQPDSISLAVSEICPDIDAETSAKDLYQTLTNRNILIQHIAYDPVDLNRLFHLRERKIIPGGPLFVQLVLGRYGAAREGSGRDFVAFAPLLDDPSLAWSVCCFGPWEQMAVATAAAFGGHARVGFENNLTSVTGKMAASNAQLAEEAAAVIRAVGRPFASVDDIRGMFPVLMS